MHAVGAGKPRDVGAVVDDDHGAERPRELHNRFTDLEKIGACQMLCAQLQESRAAGEKGAGEIDRRPAGAFGCLDVDNRVQTRQSQL